MWSLKANVMSPIAAAHLTITQICRATCSQLKVSPDGITEDEAVGMKA